MFEKCLPHNLVENDKEIEENLNNIIGTDLVQVDLTFHYIKILL